MNNKVERIHDLKTCLKVRLASVQLLTKKIDGFYLQTTLTSKSEANLACKIEVFGISRSMLRSDSFLSLRDRNVNSKLSYHFFLAKICFL